MSKYLVVANQTALSPELTQYLRERSTEDASAKFVLVVPATPVEQLLSNQDGEPRQIAARRAGEALTRFTEEGIPIAGAYIGASSLTVALDEAVGAHAQDYAGIIVCTFPPGVSRWLEPDLTSRLEAAFHLPVSHVVARPPHD